MHMHSRCAWHLAALSVLWRGLVTMPRCACPAPMLCSNQGAIKSALMGKQAENVQLRIAGVQDAVGAGGGRAL